MSERLNQLGYTLEDYRCRKCHHLHAARFNTNLPPRRCMDCRTLMEPRNVCVFCGQELPEGQLGVLVRSNAMPKFCAHLPRSQVEEMFWVAPKRARNEKEFMIKFIEKDGKGVK